MRPLFEQVSIGTGIKPVLNWFSSTALTTRAQLLQAVEAAVPKVVSAVDDNQFNMGSIPIPIETFSNNGRTDHLWIIHSLISQ